MFPRVARIALLTLFIVCIVIFYLFEFSNNQNVRKESVPIRTSASLFYEEALIDKNIFFIETSCAITDDHRASAEFSESGLKLSVRAACAVEAAARFNPLRPVYLVHTCPLHREHIWTHTKDYALQVLSLPNVRLWPVRLQQVFAGTPLQSVYDGPFQNSSFPVEHASDLLRLILLWKYGGTYLDTDVFLVRSLGNLKNFVCAKALKSINNAAIDFTFEDVSRFLLKAWIAEIQKSYNPDIYYHNGPKLLSGVMMKFCKKGKFNLKEVEDCNGFHVLPPTYFYPVALEEWYRYFEEKDAEETMKMINQSVGAHVFNHRNAKYPEKNVVDLRSNQPYAQIMKTVCPGVVAFAPDKF